MFYKIKRNAARFAVLAGIGATLVQLVTQVQAAIDAIEDEKLDQADVDLAPTMPDSALFAAGYTAGWSDGHEGRTPQVIPEPESEPADE